MPHQKLRLDSITVDPDLQAREKLDDDVIAEYAILYESGASFPALTTFYDGARYWLADGFHRIEAARMASIEQLTCDVRLGQKTDALLFAAGANAVHGLRRSPADKRRAVAMLLSHWADESNRWIAEQACVGERLVAEVRQSLQARAGTADDQPAEAEPVPAPEPAPEPEPDHPEPSAPEPSAPEPEEPQKPAAEPVRDANGKRVPPELVPAFECRPRFREITRKLAEIRREIEALWEGPAGAFLSERRGEVRSCLRDVEGALKCSEPHTICPYCKGRGCLTPLSGKRTPCLGLGWTPKTIVGDGA